MPFCVDEILEGKVASITKFGAFITLPDGSTGLVHISEVANAFVSDIHDHLSVGQTVSVKVLSIGENGRVSLSIKKALPSPAKPDTSRAPRAPRAPRGAAFDGGARQNPSQSYGQSQNPSQSQSQSGGYRTPKKPARSEPESFEDKLSRFMQESNSNLSGRYAEKKSRRRNSRD